MDYSTIQRFQTWLQDAQRYTEENITRLPTRNTIRLLIVIGAYCLLRPWLLKLAGLKQELEYEKLLKKDENSPAATEAPSASNEAIDVSQGVDSEEEGSGEKSARRRQKPLQEILEGKDRPPAEAEADSDKEIEEFLRKVIK